MRDRAQTASLQPPQPVVARVAAATSSTRAGAVPPAADDVALGDAVAPADDGAVGHLVGERGGYRGAGDGTQEQLRGVGGAGVPRV